MFSKLRWTIGLISKETRSSYFFRAPSVVPQSSSVFEWGCKETTALPAFLQHITPSQEKQRIFPSSSHQMHEIPFNTLLLTTSGDHMGEREWDVQSWHTPVKTHSSVLSREHTGHSKRGFSSGHVRVWELDYKENWALKNWCFWTTVLEKTLESLLDCKKVQPVKPKGNQFWIFIGRTDTAVETPILWPPDAKNRLIGKDLDAGKDWRWEEKGMTNLPDLEPVCCSMYSSNCCFLTCIQISQEASQVVWYSHL